jgi:hypothetical protein
MKLPLSLVAAKQERTFASGSGKVDNEGFAATIEIRVSRDIRWREVPSINAVWVALCTSIEYLVSTITSGANTLAVRMLTDCEAVEALQLNPLHGEARGAHSGSCLATLP